MTTRVAAVKSVGTVDRLGYLVCKRCEDVGHSHGGGHPVTGAPHSEERCDWCADILANEGEP